VRLTFLTFPRLTFFRHPPQSGEEPVITWTAAAAQLADTASEPGHGIAGLVASAWQARVDPYATRSLVSAAHVLAGCEVMRRLWDRVPPVPSGEALLQGAEQAEADVAGMLRHARGMSAECARTRDRAAAACGAASTGDAQAAAAAALADCDTALEILGPLQAQLKLALDSLRQAPAELADTYEAAYTLVRDGGKLPHSGHFLTGTG
jgi:hypothetical protein